MNGPETRKHTWISNAALTRLYGIKKACMDCGASSAAPTKVCPGVRPPKETGR